MLGAVCLKCDHKAALHQELLWSASFSGVGPRASLERDRVGRNQGRGVAAIGEQYGKVATPFHQL